MYFFVDQLKYLYNKNIKIEIFRKNDICIFIIDFWNLYIIKIYL